MGERRVFGVKLKRTVTERAILLVRADSLEESTGAAQRALDDIEGLVPLEYWQIDDDERDAAAILIDGVITEI